MRRPITITMSSFSFVNPWSRDMYRNLASIGMAAAFSCLVSGYISAQQHTFRVGLSDG